MPISTQKNLKVADVMATDVEFIPAGSFVREAAVLMGEIEVGALPVGTADRLEGVVTDRDILYRLVAVGADPATTTVREIMSAPPVTCRPEETLRGAMDLMAANHVRRLAVANADRRIVGWITLADLSRRLLVDSDALQKSLYALTEAPAGREARQDP